MIGDKTMKPNVAASVLTALLYAQGLLGFAGLTTVLLRDRAYAEPPVQAEQTVVADIATTDFWNRTR